MICFTAQTLLQLSALFCNRKVLKQHVDVYEVMGKLVDLLDEEFARDVKAISPAVSIPRVSAALCCSHCKLQQASLFDWPRYPILL